MIQLIELSKWFMVIQYHPDMLVWMIVIWLSLDTPATWSLANSNGDITHTWHGWSSGGYGPSMAGDVQQSGPKTWGKPPGLLYKHLLIGTSNKINPATSVECFMGALANFRDWQRNCRIWASDFRGLRISVNVSMLKQNPELGHWKRGLALAEGIHSTYFQRFPSWKSSKFLARSSPSDQYWGEPWRTWWASLIFTVIFHRYFIRA